MRLAAHVPVNVYCASGCECLRVRQHTCAGVVARRSHRAKAGAGGEPEVGKLGVEASCRFVRPDEHVVALQIVVQDRPWRLYMVSIVWGGRGAGSALASMRKVH